MPQEQDPIKTRLFLSKYTKTSFTTYIYSPFETYRENSSRGRLFGVMSLSSNRDFDSVKTLETLKSMLITRYYNSDEGTIIDALEFAIAHIKEELSAMVDKRRMELEKSLDLDCLIISIKDNVCFIASFGDSEIYLQRADKRNNLVTHLRDSLGRNQVRVASVLLEEEDKILLNTRDATNKILAMKLNSCIDEFDFEKLSKTNIKSDNVGLCLYMIGYHVKPPVIEIEIPVVVEPPKVKEPPRLYPDRPLRVREPEPVELEKVTPIVEVPARKLTPHEILYGHRKLDRELVSDIPQEKEIQHSPIEQAPSRNQQIEHPKVSNAIPEKPIKPIIQENFVVKSLKPRNHQEDNEEYSIESTTQSIQNFQRSQRPQKKIWESKNLGEITIFVYLKKLRSMIVAGFTALLLFLKANLDKSPKGRFDTRMSRSNFQHQSESRKQNFETSKFHGGKEHYSNEDTVVGPRKKINMKLFVPIIVIVILFLAFYISNSMKISQDKKTRDELTLSTEKLIDKAKTLVAESDTLSITNKPKAREDLKLSEVTLQEAEKNRLVEYNKQIDEIRRNATTIIDKKIEKNIYLDEGTIIQEISSVFQNPTITGMEIVNGKIYIALRDGKVIESQKNGSAYSFINILPDTPKLNIDKISKELDGNLLLYNLNEGLYRFSFTDKSLKKVPNMSNAVMGNVGDMTALELNGNKYLYFINQVTNQLFRSLKTGEGYADPEMRIKASEFAQVNSLAIDNKIWVSAGGTLKRYFDGKPDIFSIDNPQFDFTLTKISNIILQPTQVILSDDISKRVAVFKKNDPDFSKSGLSQSSLQYIVSFIYRGSKDPNGFGPIVDIELDGTNLYILDSKRLYLVPFVIGSEYFVGVN